MILASGSPRWKEILENFGFSLDIIIKNIDEISSEIEIENKIMDIANQKVMEVAKENQDKNVVGADTVVVIDNKILGKPKDRNEAKSMLKLLSGREHKVITAFSYVNIDNRICYKDYDVTKVYFKELLDEEIDWYIETKEPFDKAGAYGIQEKGAFLVEKIEGDFFNVMGFPLGKFVRSLVENGISLNDIEKL